MNDVWIDYVLKIANYVLPVTIFKVVEKYIKSTTQSVLIDHEKRITSLESKNKKDE